MVCEPNSCPPCFANQVAYRASLRILCKRRQQSLWLWLNNRHMRGATRIAEGYPSPTSPADSSAALLIQLRTLVSRVTRAIEELEAPAEPDLEVLRMRYQPVGCWAIMCAAHLECLLNEP